SQQIRWPPLRPTNKDTPVTGSLLPDDEGDLAKVLGSITNGFYAKPKNCCHSIWRVLSIAQFLPIFVSNVLKNIDPKAAGKKAG
ncbi:unnamed protein product, partial [Amoebophrya sp. A25]